PQRCASSVSHTELAGFHVASGCFCTERSSHVLPQHEPGADDVDGVAHGCPQPGAGPGFHARALAGVREVLARRAARDDVHGLDGGPVDLRHVTEVRGVLVAVREDARRVSVELRHPRNVGVEHGLHGEVEAAVAREQGAHRGGHGRGSRVVYAYQTTSAARARTMRSPTGPPQLFLDVRPRRLHRRVTRDRPARGESDPPVAVAGLEHEPLHAAPPKAWTWRAAGGSPGRRSPFSTSSRAYSHAAYTPSRYASRVGFTPGWYTTVAGRYRAMRTGPSGTLPPG